MTIFAQEHVPETRGEKQGWTGRLIIVRGSDHLKKDPGGARVAGIKGICGTWMGTFAGRWRCSRPLRSRIIVGRNDPHKSFNPKSLCLPLPSPIGLERRPNSGGRTG